ncbi:MAG TPA: hypothetical protein VFB48_02795 [Nitrososphaeraceae archaeon]|nr:hypothetical protein [Nitrososphaeraceae archaeon]
MNAEQDDNIPKSDEDIEDDFEEDIEDDLEEDIEDDLEEEDIQSD